MQVVISRVEASYCISVVVTVLVLAALMAVEMEQARPTGWIDFPAVTLAALFPVGIGLRLLYRRTATLSIMSACVVVCGLWLIAFGAAKLQGL